MNSNLLKRVETFVIVVIIAVIGIAYAFMQNPVPTKTTTEQSAQSEQSGQEQKVEEVSNVPVEYAGVEGKSAMDLLKSSHTVETAEYAGIGEYVVSINGVKADSTSNFWGFYVNGKQAQVGASQYISKNGDLIEWKLESISQ
jgi:hypothetical protein